jgi:hypothetical protein
MKIMVRSYKLYANAHILGTSEADRCRSKAPSVPRFTEVALMEAEESGVYCLLAAMERFLIPTGSSGGFRRY